MTSGSTSTIENINNCHDLQVVDTSMKPNLALAEITPLPSKQAHSNEIAEGVWAKARFFSFS
jgi:hypothetical protein